MDYLELPAIPSVPALEQIFVFLHFKAIYIPDSEVRFFSGSNNGLNCIRYK